MELTALCRELNNWFYYDNVHWGGEFTISDGVLDVSELTAQGDLQSGQYFRLSGSVFNDGVYKFTDELKFEHDETFEGIISPMSVPVEVMELLNDITEWITAYNTGDNHSQSPFQSESFGGYSYSKSSGNASSGGGSADAGTWQNAFRSRLNKWRKIRP